MISRHDTLNRLKRARSVLQERARFWGLGAAILPAVMYAGGFNTIAVFALVTCAGATTQVLLTKRLLDKKIREIEACRQ